ncbi:MAG: GNAT family N-acetyltransferase [Rhodospirillaceae bacterium]|nr:GNAT family N-acetyltransferase [Rhodospirillaceae bacterium]
MCEILAMQGVFGFISVNNCNNDEYSYRNKDSQGFILCRSVADEAEVLTLLVLPQFRRNGLARGFLDLAIIKACKSGAKTMFLEVEKDNNQAIALYTNMGFEQIGYRSKYYNNHDALTMRLLLFHFLKGNRATKKNTTK